MRAALAFCEIFTVQLRNAVCLQFAQTRMLWRRPRLSR
jgi:hypothetical protein